ncbi:diguanylate cyclase (GGDEF)-like protein/PAS domain S-box-containing protein [Nakamurella sp. UYEF19]|uniref:putative bifunctional diguanylate cyclase/phosphodiesterase n=1 Tax=Nakamurella sp. UYEF19 TaxID=1756392 RepID=UPI00339AE258
MRGPEASSRRHLVRTSVGTLLVITLEFFLLTYVYHHRDGVRSQQLAVARASGALFATPDDTRMAQTVLDRLTSALGNLDTDSTLIAQIQRADGRLTAGDRSPAAAVADARVAITQVAASLEQSQQDMAVQAEITFVVLLLIASVGWMAWFRRLVARHRRLQDVLTEEKARTRSDQRLAELIHSSSDLVAVCTPDATITYVSPSAQSLLGVGPADLIDTRWTDFVHPDDRVSFGHQLSAPAAGCEADLRVRLVRPDGPVLHVEGTVANMTTSETIGGLVVTVRDISGRVQLEAQLAEHAFHDPLTGLHNRRLLADRLDHALTIRADDASPLAVLFCDLDDFKNINDRLGHRVGDLVLIEVGRRIAAILRVEDTAARLGGDEFAILLERTDPFRAGLVAHRMQESFNAPFLVKGEHLRVGVSIGIAPGVPGESTGEEVLRNADVAMYLAKDRGKGGVATYEPHLHIEAVQRLELRADLFAALINDELVLHYQPTVDMDTGMLVGFEALVRWQHPEHGLLSPARFIPLAEESGLIVRLGRWVLMEACRAAALMQVDGTGPCMAVNVAAGQLVSDSFLVEVSDALIASGLPPDRLILEITESVVVQDLDNVIGRLRRLQKLGVRIAIDDFGTGYSSLSYLNRLPLDILKVDKSFVDGVTERGQAASVTAAIIAMSRTMNLDTVAEGVEHAEQAVWLIEAGCSHAQGYLWSPPVIFDRALQMLHDGYQFLRPLPEVAVSTLGGA